MKKVISVLPSVAVGALLFFSLPAHALLMLELTAGSETISVTDQELFADFSGKEGKLISIVEDWNGWDVTTVGLANPLIGDKWNAGLDLNSIAVNGGGCLFTLSDFCSDTLTIKLTNTDYMFNDGVKSYVAGVGGTTNGSVSFQSYLDDANAAFGEGTLLADSGVMGGLSFSSERTGYVTTSGMFSLTTVATITHFTVDDVTSFDYATNVKVPEPTSLALLGIGLLMAGFFGKQRKGQSY